MKNLIVSILIFAVLSFASQNLFSNQLLNNDTEVAIKSLSKITNINDHLYTKSSPINSNPKDKIYDIFLEIIEIEEEDDINEYFSFAFLLTILSKKNYFLRKLNYKFPPHTFGNHKYLIFQVLRL